MNHILAIALGSSVVCAISLQAYTFTVQNLTNKKHEVALKLTGNNEKVTPYQTVEPYNFQQNISIKFLTELQSKLTKDLFKLKDSLLYQHKNLDKAAFIKSIAQVKTDIDNNIKSGKLNSPEWTNLLKHWIDKLTAIENDINKASKVSSTDIEQWEERLEYLKQTIDYTLGNAINGEVLGKLTHVSPGNYVTFKFGGL